MIIHRALITPDGTHLVSHWRHDFVSHTDKNGKLYFLDGGLNYPRYSQNGDERFLEFGQNEVPFSLLRDHFEVINLRAKYCKLKDLTDQFLQEILDNIISNFKDYNVN